MLHSVIIYFVRNLRFHRYIFNIGWVQGPYIENRRTHLQKVLGDDNVLVVKFMEISSDTETDLSTYLEHYHKVAEEGIVLGLRCYRFFRKLPFVAMLDLFGFNTSGRLMNTHNVEMVTAIYDMPLGSKFSNVFIQTMVTDFLKT